MSASPLACAHCHAVLKINRPLPGVDILCPHCKKFFKVPAEPRLASVGSSLGQATAQPSLAPGLGAPTTNGSPSFHETALPTPQGVHATGGRLAVTVLALVAFVVVGGTVALWCFRGEPNDAKKDDKIVHKPDQKDPPIRINNKKPGPPGIVGLTNEENERLATMKRKGIAYLRKAQNQDGTWPSHKQWERHLAAMGGLTLLECGIPASDPQIQKAAAVVRSSSELPPGAQTYGFSLFILFLDRLNDPKDKPLIKHLAVRLMTGQSGHGAWSYNVPSLSQADTEELYQLLKAMGPVPWKKFAAENPEIVRKVPPHLLGLGIFQARDSASAQFYKSGGDNSNTQFALLALWAARRHKLPVDAALQLAVTRFRESQEPGGRWVYGDHHPTSPMGAMTCAGLLACAIGHGLEGAGKKELMPLEDPLIRNGLDFLSQKIGQNVPHSKVQETGAIYALWSIERVGVLFKQPKIGGKDWFRWGLEVLWMLQKEDGSWFPDRPEFLISDTCFALLFLHQANLTQDLTDKFHILEAIQATDKGKD